MIRRRINWEKIVSYFVLITLLISIVFIIIAMILAPVSNDGNLPYERIKSDYVLMLLQCILGVIAMFLPSFLLKKLKIQIPSYMLLFYVIFLYSAIYLGEVRSFYYNVPHWDTILHTFSGVMLGALGFSFVTILNRTESIPLNLSPLFVAVFSFCFAVTLGVIWEVYEFSADGLINTNMQKFALESGENLIGRNALADTMKDLIVDSIGAFVMSAIGYISLKYKKGWVEKLQLAIKK